MRAKQAIQPLFTAALIGAAGVATATPVGVSYTLLGTPGDWTLNFDVVNNLWGSDQSVYFFGVAVDGSSITSSPATFSSGAFSPWTNSGFGGSSLSYDDTWISGGHVIYAGDNLNDFVVHSDAVDAPTSVNWFAYTSGSELKGKGYFNNAFDPGWEGTATAIVGVVPEPASVALLLAGLGLCGFMVKRRAIGR